MYSDEGKIWCGKDNSKQIVSMESRNLLGLAFGAKESAGVLVDMDRRIMRLVREGEPLREVEIELPMDASTEMACRYYPLASLHFSGTTALLSCSRRMCEWDWGKAQCSCC